MLHDLPDSVSSGERRCCCRPRRVLAHTSGGGPEEKCLRREVVVAMVDTTRPSEGKLLTAGELYRIVVRTVGSKLRAASGSCCC